MKKLFVFLAIFGMCSANEIPLDAKIYIAGHRGLVGNALVRKLESEGYSNILSRTSKELDLRRQADTEAFFEEEKPEYVIIAAAKVGGIWANKTQKADFMYDNLMIATNIIHAAYKTGVKKLLFLGSSCIYPRECPQPMKESHLLTGPLEPTNDAYALAKIAALKLCQFYNEQYGTSFISCMPTNLYGPNDNFHPEHSHVFAAFIRKFVEAKRNDTKEVVIWGTGSPKREFLHVDDLADACLFLLRHYNDNETVNVGWGRDLTILELAHLIKEAAGYEGELIFDSSKPDGTPRKIQDISKLTNLGWQPKIPLKEGTKETIEWFETHY